MVKLKVKFLKLSAGRPVVILNKEFADNSSIHVNDRVSIEKSNKKITAVVDLAGTYLEKNEAIVSTEVINYLSLKQGEIINIESAPIPKSLNLIKKKFLGESLTKSEIETIIKDIVENNLTEVEIAYFISALYKSNMSIKETINTIKAIVSTGKILKFKGKVADKHSIGGIPGRTTPIIVSICAAAGLLMPKTSSRAITTPAGTADAMEVLCKVDFKASEIQEILKKTNACIVWGGSLNLAPADDKIIFIERAMNLDPESQLLSSILAKKIAVDSNYVLIDIPYGKTAKVTKIKAERLAKKFKKIGKYFKIKIECSLRRTIEPLGNGIGPLMEIIDVIKVLKRKDSCHDLEKRALELSGKILEMTKKSPKNKGMQKALEILNSGLAYKKFKDIVKAQGGDLDKFKPKLAKFKKDIIAKENIIIKEMNIKKINYLANLAGCPLDKKAGLYLYKHVNQKINRGEKILTIYSESKPELDQALKYYKNVSPIKFKKF